MAVSVIESKVIVKTDLRIVCSECGAPNPYTSPTAHIKWDGRDWYCKACRPLASNAYKLERNGEIYQRVEGGESLASISGDYGLSRTRVAQAHWPRNYAVITSPSR